MTSCIRVEDYVSRLQSLSGQETLSFSKELAPLLDSYSKNVHQISGVSPSEAIEGIRSIFSCVQKIFFKFQNSLRDVEQEKLLVFATEILVVDPAVSNEVSRGLEETIVRVCRVSAEHVFDAQAKGRMGGGFEGLFRLLSSLTANMLLVTPKTAPLVPFLELYKSCSRLFVRNLPRFDDASLDFMMTGLNLTEMRIREIPGLRPHLLKHWANLLTGLNVEDVVSLRHAERFFVVLVSLVDRMDVVEDQQHLGISASLHAIMDWEEKLLSFMERRAILPTSLFVLGVHRDVTLGHLCRIYPRFLLERYEQGKSIRGVVFAQSATVLKIANGRGGVYAEDPLFGLYVSALSDFIQNIEHRPRAVFFEALLVSTRIVWRSKPSFIDVIPYAWSCVAEVIRNIQSISPSGLKTLGQCMVDEIVETGSSEGYVGQTFCDAFLDAVEAFDAIVPRCVGEYSGLSRDLLSELPLAVVKAMCEWIRPTAILDWFERIQESGACGIHLDFEHVLHTTYLGLIKMDPKTVSSAYACEQFSRFLKFGLRHLSQMSDRHMSRLSDCGATIFQGALIDSRTKWLSDTEVSIGYVKVWVSELQAILDRVSPAGGSGKALSEPRAGVKDLLYIHKVLELLGIDLLGFSKGGGEFGPGMLEAMLPMLEIVDGLVASSLQMTRAPELRALTASMYDNLFWFFSKYVPSLLINRLVAAESGKISAEFVRTMEKLLLACGRFSSIADQQMRLILLELVGVELERFCRTKGVQLDRHPTLKSPTLHSPSEKPSPLHLLMEASMDMDDLDVACATHCKDYAAVPERQQWLLFTLRFYVRRYIEKLRKESMKAHRELDKVGRNFSPEVHTKNQSCLGSSLNFFKLEMVPPKLVYRCPIAQSYEELCNASSTVSHPEQVLYKAHAYFRDVLARTSSRSQFLQDRFLNLWAHYERGVAALERHVAKMPGYNPLGTRCKSVPVEGEFPLLDYKDVSSDEVETRFVPPWISGLLSGGELGLARAIAESFAPGNASFANRFLQELELLDDDVEEERPVPEGSAKESFCGDIEAPKPSAPQGRGGGKLHSPHRAKHAKRPARSSPKREEQTAPPSPPNTKPSEPVSDQSASQKAFGEGLVEEFHKLSLSERAGSFVQKKEKKPSLPKGVMSPLSCPDSEERAITAADVERCMQRPLGPIDRRVHRWKSAFFCAPSEDQYDRHTYPFQLIHPIREYGEKEVWASALGRMNEHFVCIGKMERYGQGLPPLFGVFSEAFSSEGERELYHHYLHDRSEEALRDNYRRFGSFFDSDICHTPKETSRFQERLFRRFCDFRSFFSSLANIPSQLCCGGRFTVQIGDMAVRIDDRKLGKAYTLALRVRAVPSSP
jgi:hypothetical protein